MQKEKLTMHELRKFFHERRKKKEEFYSVFEDIRREGDAPTLLLLGDDYRDSPKWENSPASRQVN